MHIRSKGRFLLLLVDCVLMIDFKKANSRSNINVYAVNIYLLAHKNKKHHLIEEFVQFQHNSLHNHYHQYHE